MKQRFTHRLSDTPEHYVWGSMIQRCTNPKHPDYDDYGGRGISIHPLFLKFENFYAIVGPRKSPKHSLDRYPDNDGNYEPGNIRWATAKEQSLNKRTTQRLTVNGETRLLQDWATLAGISAGTLRTRLANGWYVERAVSVSKQPCGKRCLIEFNGMCCCVTDWSRTTGIKEGTIRKRLNIGWSVERTLTTPCMTQYQNHQ